MCATYVGIICSRPEVQVLLPQVFLGNEKMFLVRDLLVLRPDLPPNVFFWRLRSSWTNTNVLSAILSLVARSLRSLRDRFQFFMLWDCASQHLDLRLFTHARQLGIPLILIPAQATWLLQPCDTHAFVQVKRFLKTEYLRELMQSPDGQVSDLVWMRVMVRAVQMVIQANDWGPAFAADGISDDQRLVSRYIREQIRDQACAPAPATAPSLDALGVLLPGRCALRRDRILTSAVQMRPAPRALPAPASRPRGALALTLDPDVPSLGRTRSASRIIASLIAPIPSDAASIPVGRRLGPAPKAKPKAASSRARDA